jgi:hypothetical protein
LKTCPPNPLQKKRRKGRSVFSVKFHMRDTKCKKKEEGKVASFAAID